ncbi:MAG: hypothetical protein IPL28_15040 [Chloroflexi bacterium]|nr:hypothetical protein [Chloroflexota bacterium]
MTTSSHPRRKFKLTRPLAIAIVCRMSIFVQFLSTYYYPHWFPRLSFSGLLVRF